MRNGGAGEDGAVAAALAAHEPGKAAGTTQYGLGSEGQSAAGTERAARPELETESFSHEIGRRQGAPVLVCPEHLAGDRRDRALIGAGRAHGEEASGAEQRAGRIPRVAQRRRGIFPPHVLDGSEGALPAAGERRRRSGEREEVACRWA